MEFKINDLSLSEKEVEITFTYDEVKDNINNEILKRTKTIQIPGFRKGKVPLSMIKKMYGDALDFEASEKIASDKFFEISEQNHFHHIGTPSITDFKFKPGENLFYKVKYEIMPKVDVKDYTSLEIDIPDFTVKDEDVESDIKNILKSNSTTEPADVVGDDRNFIIEVELKRLDDKGELYQGSKPEVMQIDLSNNNVQKEIIDNSKGTKAGESFTFSFTDVRTEKKDTPEEQKISETYNYSAEIKSIKKIVLPQLDEEFVKRITKDKASNEQELREQIKKDIQNYYDQQNKDYIQRILINKIVKNNDFVPPKSMVSGMLENLLKEEEEETKRRGYKKFDKKQAEESLLPVAEFEVKWYLISGAIKEKENINVSDEELNELAKADAEKTGIALDKLITYYKSRGYTNKLTDQKLIDFLKEKNKINKLAPEEFSKKTKEDQNEK